MDKHELVHLAEKYADQTANSQEKLAIDIFFKKLQDQDIFGTVKLDQFKGNQIFQKIEAKIQLKKVRKKKLLRSVIAVAAVLFILAGTVLLGLLTENNITHIAAKGEKKEIELNDGSRVFLNSGSTISYSENFKQDRKMSLEGEAYFEVAPNPEKPFRIKTKNLETKVLGTSFNIKAYKGGIEMVSVNSGTVEVSSLNDLSQKQKLTTDMQLVFTGGDRPQISEENSANHNAWTKNIIVLNKTSLGETSKILENWYDVKISFENSALEKLTISGKFKDEKLENVLASIAMIKQLKIEYKTPKTIYIRAQTDK